MCNTPLVSIGMPVYNGERYLRRALDSLLDQDYKNFEILVSDNASTDQTNEICNEYAAKDRRIKIYKQLYNVGVIKNFEKVVELAQGDYFMWAAVDDFWLPSFISSLIEQLEKYSDAGVAMSAVDRVRNDGTLFDEIRFSGKKNTNQKSSLGMSLGLLSSIKYNLFIYGIFRTRLLREILPIPMANSGDRWFLLKLALNSRFRYVDRLLHVRTISEATYYERYPEDDFARKKLKSDKKWFHFDLIPCVYSLIIQSKSISNKRKLLFIPIILSYLFYRRLVIGIRSILKCIILRCCSKKLQTKIIRIVK